MRKSNLLAIGMVLGLVAQVSAQGRQIKQLRLAIAPAIVKGGDLPTDLLEPMQEVVAEMLSWEASLVQVIKVVDPSLLQTALEKNGWDTRTEITDSEIEEARTASRQLDGDAVVLTRFMHQGSMVDWQVALGYRQETLDKSQRISGTSREDEFVQKIREQALNLIDTLGVNVPATARQMVASRGKVGWEAMVEYASGIRDQKEGKREDALRHLREAARRAPFLPSLQVRLKKLEAEMRTSR